MKLRRSFSVACAVAAVASLAAANVQILNGTAAGFYATIQSAVDSAYDGNILVVTAGSYPGFTIDDKALAIFAANGAAVTVTGTIEVRNLASTKTVVLSGMKSQLPGGVTPPVALRLLNDVGYVRLQDCTLNGGSGLWAPCVHSGGQPNGARGVLVDNSSHVSFVDSALRGGNGDNSGNCDCGIFSWGGDGEIALRVANSVVALHGCQVEGGWGGCGHSGGFGLTGGDVLGNELFAAACTFKGGEGGPGVCGGGYGGNGLSVATTAIARLLGNTYVRGNGGDGGGCGSGDDGHALTGGAALVQLSGTARTLASARTTLDSQPLPMTITGQPGDVAFAALHRRPSWTFDANWNGVWLQPHANLGAMQPLGVIPASGVLNTQFQPRPCGPNQVARVDYVQLAVVDTLGTKFIAEPATILVIDG